ncbi:type II secretion system minor pseudopilin GspH [Thalassotalea montiporae]
MLNRTPSSRSTGFTLIEMMMVIVVVGILASAIQFTFRGNQSDKQLAKESQRFAGMFELASEYGMLNNIELGLYIEEQSYQFLAFDGKQWVELSDTEALVPVELPENMGLSLTLDELPVEPSLLTELQLVLAEQDDFKEGEDLPPQPQVLMLSGGDITPFSVSFYFLDEFADSDIEYKVTGLYHTPLMIEGPINGQDR